MRAGYGQNTVDGAVRCSLTRGICAEEKECAHDAAKLPAKSTQRWLRNTITKSIDQVQSDLLLTEMQAVL